MEDREAEVIGTCALCQREVTGHDQIAEGQAGVICVAVMESAEVFGYGLAGSYRFLKPPPLKTGDAVCLRCMKHHPYEVHKSVECDVCHEKYQLSMPRFRDDPDEKEFGWGCAAYVREREDLFKLEISCGFGSRHDCVHFPIERDIGLKVDDRVCDNCIERMLAAGEVSEDNSFWEELRNKKPNPNLIEWLKSPGYQQMIDELEAEHGPLPEPDPEHVRMGCVPIRQDDPMKHQRAEPSDCDEENARINAPCGCGGKVKVLKIGYSCPIHAIVQCEACGAEMDRSGTDGIRVLSEAEAAARRPRMFLEHPDPDIRKIAEDAMKHS